MGELRKPRASGAAGPRGTIYLWEQSSLRGLWDPSTKKEKSPHIPNFREGGFRAAAL